MLDGDMVEDEDGMVEDEIVEDGMVEDGISSSVGSFVGSGSSSSGSQVLLYGPGTDESEIEV